MHALSSGMGVRKPQRCGSFRLPSPAARLLIACLAAATATSAAAASVWDGTQAAIALEDGTTVQLQEFRGASKWAALQYLFSTAEVAVECPGVKVRRLHLLWSPYCCWWCWCPW